VRGRRPRGRAPGGRRRRPGHPDLDGIELGDQRRRHQLPVHLHHGHRLIGQLSDDDRPGRHRRHGGRGGRPGQYLAGLTAQAAVRPKAVQVGRNRRASAKAIIIDQVTVGVAVTVGSLARLRTAVRIAPVTGGWVGSTPRLNIPVRNTGQTFAQATGRISCRVSGRSHSYRVIMETVLPGGRAVLPVNALGLASGRLPCTVRLRTAAGTLISWSGIVSLPSQVRTRTYHPAKGVYVSLPESTIPGWAIALLVLGGLILFTLLTLVILRRRQPARGTRAARGRARPAPAGRSRAGRGRAAGSPAGRLRRPRRRTAT
jgi:hypothetical protein